MYTSIGLMSGTSMDGIDAALIHTDGKAIVKEIAHLSLDYDDEFKLLLKAAEYTVRKYSGDLTLATQCYSQELINFLIHELSISVTEVAEKVAVLNAYFAQVSGQVITFENVVNHSTQLHAKIIKQLLKKANYHAKQIDVIGYHGQTLFHQPANKITIQVGDGHWLAQQTGIMVVNNFRNNDVAAGGQGAPLAPLYHQALAIRDTLSPVAVVNCGGIANITVITGEILNAVIGFDTGPGNVLVDRMVKKTTHGLEAMDKDGRYGQQGQVNNAVLQALYAQGVITDTGENYFNVKPPKSLDVGHCILIPELAKLNFFDACRTLEAFTADTIVRSIEHLSIIPQRWILVGGGWSNPIIQQELITRLQHKLGNAVQVNTADEVGWQNKALEAQVFAYLAVRSILGLPISVPGTTRVPAPMTGGVVHHFN